MMRARNTSLHHVAAAVLVSFACAGLLPALCMAQSPARTGVIAAHVLDAETGVPVDLVQVVLDETNRSATSDDDGRFRMPNLSPGIYTLRAYRIGYETLTRSVRVPAGDTLHLTLYLTGSPVLAGEVVVEGAAGKDERLADPVLALEGSSLRQNLGTTIAETLADEPGIAMRSMGPAPARPVLRGLGGERLLVLEDGGRTGDLSATSADHALVIDPLSAERIELVRGPAALVYGPNTLGGVVNVVRGYIPASRPARVRAGYTLQAESVNRGVATGVSVDAPAGPLAIHADGSCRRAGDVRTPVGALQNTALEACSGAFGGSVVGAWGSAGIAGSYYASDYGIPGGFVGAHPGGVDLSLERRHLAARAEIVNPSIWIPRVELKGDYTWFHQQEFEASGALGTEFGLISYHGSLIAHTRQMGPLHRGAVGIWSEYRNYAAGGLIFTPASTDWTVAAFAYQDVHLGAWAVQGGLRFDYRRVQPKGERMSEQIGYIRARTFQGLSGAVSVLRQVADGLTVGTTFMRSIRVPGIEELYSEGPHLAAYSFDVGDPELDLETGWGAEAVARYERGRGHAHAAVFYNRFGSFIFPRNTGRTDFRTLLPIYQTAGAEAVMRGGEVAGELHLGTAVTLEAGLGYVRGSFAGTDEPIPFMPPLNGRVGVSLDRGPWRAGVVAHLAGRQERVGEFEQPTAGYATMDVYLQRYFQAFGLLHTIDFGIENVTDAEYRDHLSRVKVIMPEPGRNVKLLYRAYF